MYTLHLGKSEKILPQLEENSISAVITDAPYGIKFMNKKWDYDVPSVELWKEVYRVMKPGGIALIFAGSRTQHRMAVNVEDAGFEIKDTIMWIYGSGFPKSHNISAALDKKTDTPEAELWGGYGTALKPAYEPIIVAMKPTDGTYVNNALKHGVAGLNIDGCRVPYSTHDDPRINKNYKHNAKAGLEIGQHKDNSSGIEQTLYKPDGRFPANLIHDGSDEVVDVFPDARVQLGDLKNHNKNRKSPNGCFGEMGPAKDYIKKEETNKSASRFFYCAKANKKDRGDGNKHPTVKPISLMRYLCRLVKMPKESIILDPFMGSGRTGISALLEGNSFIGIEKEEDSFKICEKHIPKYKDFDFEKENN